MAESKEELKSLLMKVKEESEKAGLKLKIQNTKIMVSRPITSWQIDGKTMETVTDFIFLGSKITADGDCSHEIKRCSLEESNSWLVLELCCTARGRGYPARPQWRWGPSALGSPDSHHSSFLHPWDP